MLGGDTLETARDAIKRILPRGARHAVRTAHHRIQKPRVEAQRLAERGAFRTQAAEVRRMIRVAGNRGAARAIRCRKNPAADAAIRTGRPHCPMLKVGRGHGQYTSCW
jgi:hypothetical protein